MYRLLLSAATFLIAISISAQQTVQRPKLIVGIVVDQMRWDYLYRFYERYDKDGGFKRMLNQGFMPFKKKEKLSDSTVNVFKKWRDQGLAEK